MIAMNFEHTMSRYGRAVRLSLLMLVVILIQVAPAAAQYYYRDPGPTIYIAKAYGAIDLGPMQYTGGISNSTPTQIAGTDFSNRAFVCTSNDGQNCPNRIVSGNVSYARISAGGSQAAGHISYAPTRWNVFSTGAVSVAGMPASPSGCYANASETKGLNDSGQVVGACNTYYNIRPVIWDASTNTSRILTTDYSPAGAPSPGWAFAINNSNLIAGQQLQEAVLWNGPTAAPTKLNTGTLSKATFVSDTGFIAGEWRYNGQTRGFIRNPNGTIVRTLLPNASTNWTDASEIGAINNSGTAVGYTYRTSDQYNTRRAAMWNSDGTFFDLTANTALPAGLTTFTWAGGINDRGEILVLGVVNGQQHAFLLVRGTGPIVGSFATY